MSKAKTATATATATPMPTAVDLLASALSIPSAKPGRQPSPVPDQVREAIQLLAKRVYAGQPTASAITIKRLATATGCRPGRLTAIYREALDILQNGADAMDDEAVDDVDDVDDVDEVLDDVDDVEGSLS